MKKLLLFIFLGSIFTSCSSVKIKSDYDKNIDFTQYKTLEYYGWADDSDKILNRFDKERMEEAAGNEFKKRGMEFVKSGGDLVVALFIVTQDKTQVTATTTGYGGYGGYGGYYGYGPGWGYGGGMSSSYTTYNEYDYTVGTLAISVYDAKKEQLVWEGIAEGEINDNPQKREKNIPTTIAKIMAMYPIKPISK